jgi:hypothetical protein
MSGNKQRGTLSALTAAILFCNMAQVEATGVEQTHSLCGFSRTLRIIKAMENLNNCAESKTTLCRHALAE